MRIQISYNRTRLSILTCGSLVEDREQVDGSGEGIKQWEKFETRLQGLLLVQNQNLDGQENQNTDQTRQHRRDEPGSHYTEIRQTGYNIVHFNCPFLLVISLFRSFSLPMKPIFIQLIPLTPWATSANPTVAPTMLWVVETGSFRKVATNSHTHDPEKRHHLVTLHYISHTRPWK